MRCLLCNVAMPDHAVHFVGANILRVAVCGACMNLYVTDSPARVVVPSEKPPSPTVWPKEAKS